MGRLLNLLLCSTAVYCSAAEINFNFEDNTAGDSYVMKNVKGGEATATATVTADPTNSANKVLHINSKSWDTLVAIPLPDGITGENFSDVCQNIEFDIYRTSALSANDYMQWAIMLGNDILYWDEGYPNQGGFDNWQQKSYKLTPVKNNANTIYIGYNSNEADYYIDNIKLSGLASSSTGRLVWTGKASNVWDIATSANFTNELGDASTFKEGNSAIFNDTPGSDQKVMVSGTIHAYDITFENNRHMYELQPAASGAKLTGRGTFTVDNGADVTLGVANEIEKGIELKNGKLRLASTTVPGTFGKSVNVTSGALDFCVNNSSDSYMCVSTPITVNGNTLDVYTSRYTYWTSPVSGNGDINIYCGGERSYMGHQKEKVQPDWSQYSGTVTLYPHTDVIPTAGFYGIVFEGNKSFNPEDYEPHRTNHVFENCKVVATKGTALASEGNDRGVRIGELQLDKDARLYGYYKSSDKARSYFLLGNKNTDALLAGVMCPPEKDGKVVSGQTLGIIKEGKGTYTITNNNNRLTGGIKVLDGRILVNNDTEEARKNKLSGATGVMHDPNLSLITVFSNGTVGGTGSIAGNTDVYGTIQPGADGTGTLTLADFTNDTPVTLIIRPGTVIEIEAGKDSHDKIEVSGDLCYYNLTQDFNESDKMPVIKLTVLEGATYNDGDELTVITAKKKDSLDGVIWGFDLVAPAGWRVAERESADSYSVVLVADSKASIESITTNHNSAATYYSIDGRVIKDINSATGVVIVNENGKSNKIIK